MRREGFWCDMEVFGDMLVGVADAVKELGGKER
jgi:hypothetical protein